MAAVTVGFCIRKNKGWMTKPAIEGGVLSLQRKFGAIVIERIYLPVPFPSLGTVANTAANFKITPVGRILYPSGHKQDQERNG